MITNLIVILIGISIGCRAFKDDNTCKENCFSIATYSCTKDTCVCHVGFGGDGCHKQIRESSRRECNNNGQRIFLHGGYECECDEGYWGRRCQHTNKSVFNLTDIENKTRWKHCKGRGNEEECEPPHLRVECGSENLDTCDENGNVRPYKKCPFPWLCYEKFRNGVCDWECERKECLWDGFDCSTDRACPDRCTTKSGVCDLSCSLKDEIDNYRTADRDSVIIEVSLDVTEQYWIENQREIVANLSAPIRTPLLVYDEKFDEEMKEEGLEYGRRDTHSRLKRLASTDNGRTVKLELLPGLCHHSSECAVDAESAGAHLSVAFFNKGFVSFIHLSSEKEGLFLVILAVFIVILLVPTVLIGHRVITARIWIPPKSIDEVPEVITHDLSTLQKEQEQVMEVDEQMILLITSERHSESVLEDVDRLMTAGANVNHADKDGFTPLSLAITSLRPSVCARLVQWGANPAATTHSGASCLHLAVAQDDVQCVEWLLCFPAVKNNINEVDEADRSPLAMAARGGCASARIAEVLIEAGADVLHQGNQSTMWRYRGRSPLHWAAHFNNLEVMKVLLDHRSDVNCVDTEGCTPLHFAVQRGSEDGARMLLEGHAYTEIVNGIGEDPLSIAKKTGIQPLIDLLLWYTDVQKEALAMKRRGKKREKKKSSDSNNNYKRHRSRDSPFADSISSYSVSTGYSFPPTPSDSSSIGSDSTTVPSSPSGYVFHSCLTPIHEKPAFHLSFDTVKTESYIPPNVLQQSTTVSGSDSPTTVTHLESAFVTPDSFLLTPYDERSEEQSPKAMTTSYWMDQEESMDGLRNEENIMDEFFLDFRQ